MTTPDLNPTLRAALTKVLQDDMPDWIADLVKSVPVPVEVVTR